MTNNELQSLLKSAFSGNHDDYTLLLNMIIGNYRLDYSAIHDYCHQHINNSHALNMLGNLYFSGRGVERNLCEAYKFYSMSAQMLNEYAQLKVGCMLMRGIGVTQDHDKSLKFLTLSAAQNNAEAQSNISYMYFKGIGMKKDYRKASIYLKLCMNNPRRNFHLNQYMNNMLTSELYDDYFQVKQLLDEIQTQIETQNDYIAHLETIPGSAIYHEAHEHFINLANKNAFIK